MAKYSIIKKEETLKNGLHVILVQKPEYVKSLFLLAAPVGGFVIRQNIDGQIKVHPTGCAHFLEHQMFHYQGGDVTDDFARMQASTNAFTSYTETAYYFHTTGDIEKPLNLLLDFVENLDITQESVNKEKGIILSEYKMYQQSPETHLLKNTWDALYKNHPMHIDILGTVEDIEGMHVEDLQNFYHLNYDPSRLTLVGVTGRNLDEVFEIIEKNQENVVSHVDQKVERAIEEEPVEVINVESNEEMDIFSPYICIAYKLKPKGNIQDCLKQDLAISTCLDATFSSINPDYQKWMDERIITQMFGAECDISPDHAYLMFYGQTDQLDAFTQIIEENVKKMQTTLIAEETLNSLKKRGIAQNIRGLDQFEGLAIDLLHAHLQGYDLIDSLSIIESLTPQMIQDTVNQFDYSHKIVTKVCPKTSN